MPWIGLQEVPLGWATGGLFDALLQSSGRLSLERRCHAPSSPVTTCAISQELARPRLRLNLLPRRRIWRRASEPFAWWQRVWLASATPVATYSSSNDLRTRHPTR